MPEVLLRAKPNIFLILHNKVICVFFYLKVSEVHIAGSFKTGWAIYMIES